MRIAPIVIVLLTAAKLVQAQPAADTNYIKKFRHNNTLEFTTGYYGTRFQFYANGNRKPGFQLAANSSAYVGVSLDYNWLTLRYSTAFPGTSLDERTELEYTGLAFNFGYHQFRFHPFYDSYNGLLIPRTGGGFEPFKNIRFRDAGVDIYWFGNPAQFSAAAAHSFSKQQVRSAGAPVLIITPLWQKINWVNPNPALIGDSVTYHLLASNPEWFSLTMNGGYCYTFSFENGKWLISPAAALGGGLLRETDHPDQHLQPVTALEGWVSAGYNGKRYYCYLSASWSKRQSRLLVRRMDQGDYNISITAGFRFAGLGKKILGIL